MGVALIAAERSTCNRGKVGAVIVQDNNIVATGFNGAPPGQPHCTEVGCDELMYTGANGGEVKTSGCRRAVHAEANAIAWAARRGISTSNATVYCTHEPCSACARLLVSAGIKEVVFDKEYREGATELLESCEVTVVWNKQF